MATTSKKTTKSTTKKKEKIVKAARKAPARKAAATKPKVNGEAHRAAVAASWQDKNVAARRSVKHRVKVGTDEYRSVLDAFTQLGLPIGKHQAFRADLKEKGQAKFEGHNFKLIEAR